MHRSKYTLATLDVLLPLDVFKEAQALPMSADDYLDALWPAYAVPDLLSKLDKGAFTVDLDALHLMKAELCFEFGQDLEKVFHAILEGKTLADQQSVDQASLGRLTAVAAEHLAQGAFLEAKALYRVLLLLDPTSLSALIGYAACLQELELYSEAYDYYMYAQELDMKEPRIPLNASLCLVMLGEYEEAMELAQRAVLLCQSGLRGEGCIDALTQSERSELERLRHKGQQLARYSCDQIVSPTA